MKDREEASVDYRPDDEPQDAREGARLVLAAAQRELLGRSGVEGVGLGQGPAGGEAIVVYVRDKEAGRQLPHRFRGWDIVAEVTGEIGPLGG